MSEAAVNVPEAPRPKEPVKMNRPERPKALAFKNFQLAEFSYADFAATLPEKWTVDDALRPEFWVNCAHLLQKSPVTNEPDKAGSIIALRSEDHSFFARLYVRAVLQRGLIVEILKPDERGICWLGKSAKQLGQEKPDAPFEVKWQVQHQGFAIIRKSDQQIVNNPKECRTREMAQEWIEETLKAG